MFHCSKSMGLGLESLRAHLSPCVLFCYSTMLNIVVCRDSKAIPKIVVTLIYNRGQYEKLKLNKNTPTMY